MTGFLLAMLDDAPEVDVSAHLPLVTDLLTLALGLMVAFFVVRPELWRRIFFQRVDPRPAALTRIAFGLVVLVTFLDLLKPHGPLDDSVARYLFTDEGLWLTDMARKNYGGPVKILWDPEHGFEHWYDIFKAVWGKFSILHFRSDPPFVFGVYTAMITSLVLMILGVWTRWTTILSWILVESVYRYSPVFYTGGDTVVRVFLFLGMFTQWGEAYSIDSWRRRRKAILADTDSSPLLRPLVIVAQALLSLGTLIQWGLFYIKIRRKRPEIIPQGHATSIPPLRQIAAWPLRLMMLQLTIIYCATGLLKSGSTWQNGTALYYALNLDHFYRWPQMGLVGAVHYLGILPVLVIVVHWWEMLFPVSLVGAVINAYERERAAGIWPKAAIWRRWLSYVLLAGAWAVGAYVAGLGVHYYMPVKVLQSMHLPRPVAVSLAQAIAVAIPVVSVVGYLAMRRFLPRVFVVIRHWVLGKRFWLVFGFGMHIGIDAGMNVGTFANVMMAVYLAWLSGDEIEAFWRYIFTDPQAPGQGSRPRRKGWRRKLLAPVDRLVYRAAPPPLVVLHHPGDASVRRAALLRVWDLGHRLQFQADPDVRSEQLMLRRPGEKTSRVRAQAGHALIRVLPGLWWMRGLRHIPGLSTGLGLLAMKILRQR